MQFDYTRLNPVFVTRQPAVGNLYLARGGKPTRFWLVASITKDEGVKLLGLDSEGKICSTAGYNYKAVAGMPLVGYVPDFDKLEFQVEPIPS